MLSTKMVLLTSSYFLSWRRWRKETEEDKVAEQRADRGEAPALVGGEKLAHLGQHPRAVGKMPAKAEKRPSGTVSGSLSAEGQEVPPEEGSEGHHQRRRRASAGATFGRRETAQQLAAGRAKESDAILGRRPDSAVTAVVVVRRHHSADRGRRIPACLATAAVCLVVVLSHFPIHGHHTQVAFAASKRDKLANN
jgi:hypothetical protein